MKLLEKKDLKDHDVYEICSAENYPKHWNENSLFTTMEDFSLIAPYLDEVFLQYHYYGPQKITTLEWESLKRIALAKRNQKKSIITFFNKINNWIEENNSNYDYFWIYGV